MSSRQEERTDRIHQKMGGEWMRYRDSPGSTTGAAQDQRIINSGARPPTSVDPEIGSLGDRVDV
jgi:hypothetical protein